MNTGEPGKPGYGQDGRDGQRGRPGVPGLPGVPGPPGAHGLNGYCDPSACNLQAGAAHQSLDVKGPAGNWESNRQRPRDWTGLGQLLWAHRILHSSVFTASLSGFRSSINLQPFVPATSPSEGRWPHRVIKKQKRKKRGFSWVLQKSNLVCFCTWELFSENPASISGGWYEMARNLVYPTLLVALSPIFFSNFFPHLWCF